MADSICMGCGVEIDASSPESLCMDCYEIVHNPKWVEFQRTQEALGEQYASPEPDPRVLEAKLSQLIDMVGGLQADLAQILSAVKRYEVHYREVRGESRQSEIR